MTKTTQQDPTPEPVDPEPVATNEADAGPSLEPQLGGPQQRRQQAAAEQET